MTTSDKRQPTADQINATIGDNTRGVVVGKNIKQVVHNYADAPTIDLATAQARLAKLPVDAIPPVTPLPAGSSRLFAPNPFFTGRQDELKKLAAALKGGADRGETMVIGQPRIAGATGIGGIGKSQLASEFAHRYGQYFMGGVAWISLADPGSVSAEVVNACLSLPGLPPHVAEMAQPDQVRLIREAWQQDIPRLLIFDNCEDEALLAEWRPTSGAARVLVTSRRSSFDPTLNVTLLPLRTLPRPDSISLLQRFRPDLAADDPDLDAIAADLGDLPLALHMAGSYLKRYRNAITPAAYCDQLRTVDPLTHRSLANAAGHSPTAHDLSVARAFALSVDRLDHDDEIDALGLALLARAACFAPGEPIPRQLLVASLPTTEEDAAVDELLVEDAFIRLTELGLLDSDENGDPVLHRLLAHFVLSATQDAAAPDDVERAVISAAYRDNVGGDPRQLLIWLPHLRHVTATALMRSDEPAAMLANNLGLHLGQAGDPAGARPYLEQALIIRLEVLGEQHPDTALSLNNLGLLLQDMGDLEAARRYLEQALTIHQTVLGDLHPNSVKSLNNLGLLLQDMGDLIAARPYLEQSLASFKEVLGEQHPDTALSLNNLGMLLQDMGDYAAARPYLEQALSSFKEVLGEQHPDIALSLNNLGLLLQDMGDYAAAHAYLEQALTIRLEVLGEQHPDTAHSLNNLGGILRATGDNAAAHPYFEQALVIQKKILGEKHTDIAKSLNNLGGVLRYTGDYVAALPYFEQALRIHNELLGAKHPDTASSFNNLGSLLQDMGDHAAARHYYEQALMILQDLFGDNHPDIARGFSDLGSLLLSLGDMVTARPYFEQALIIRQKLLGEQHPHTATSLWWMGVVLAGEGKLLAAQFHYERALNIFEAVLGPEHPRTQGVRGYLDSLNTQTGPD